MSEQINNSEVTQTATQESHKSLSDVYKSLKEAVPTDVTPVETKPIEAKPTEVTPVEVNKEDEFTSKFSKLARKEAELISKEQEVKRLEKEYQDYKALKDISSENPWAVIEHFGLSIDQLLDQAAKEEEYAKNPAIKEVNELKKQMEELRLQAEKEKEDARKAADARAISEYKAHIRNELSKDEDNFEFINKTDNYDMVYDVIREHYNRTNGQILDTKVAAEMVEKHLEEEFDKSFTKIKKVAKRFQSSQVSSVPVLKPSEEAKNDNRSVTLSNEMRTGVVSSKPREQMTDEEHLNYALSFLKKG